MKDSARYAKIVEWSEEDGCYVGSAPGLVHGGCHGPDEKAVFAELCQIVDEAVELYRLDGEPLPPPTAGRDLANELQRAAAAEELKAVHGIRPFPKRGGVVTNEPINKLREDGEY